MTSWVTYTTRMLQVYQMGVLHVCVCLCVYGRERVRESVLYFKKSENRLLYFNQFLINNSAHIHSRTFKYALSLFSHSPPPSLQTLLVFYFYNLLS